MSRQLDNSKKNWVYFNDIHRNINMLNKKIADTWENLWYFAVSLNYGMGSHFANEKRDWWFAILLLFALLSLYLHDNGICGNSFIRKEDTSLFWCVRGWQDCKVVFSPPEIHMLICFLKKSLKQVLKSIKLFAHLLFFCKHYFSVVWGGKE